MKIPITHVTYHWSSNSKFFCLLFCEFYTFSNL